MKICMTGAKGFTLIELIVTVTIFGIVSLVLAQTFIQYTQLQARIENAATLGGDARFVNEMVVRAARNDLVDWSNGPYSGVVHDLQLVSRDGTDHLEIAQKNPGDGVCPDPGISCLAIRENGGSWSVVTSRHVSVQQFDVIIKPPTDPFDTTNPLNIQPFVTIAMNLTYTAPNPRENASLRTQTSVDSRVYER